MAAWKLGPALATGNTLEGLCAAWLASRLLCRDFCFRLPDAVFLFAAIAAASSVLAATAGVSTLYLAGGVEAASFFTNWYTWWQGDTTGIILVTPLVLAWSRAEMSDERRPPRSEVAIFWTLLAATLASVFGFSRGELAGAMEFLLIPFMAWAGCRFSERQVTLVVVAAAGTAVWGAIEGRGPYRLLTLNESLLVLQAFASTLALMALVLYAATQQRADAIRVLEIWRDYLRNIVRDRARRANDASQRFEETQALAQSALDPGSRWPRRAVE
jgi:integral membrane sensor domain MASE1